MRLSTFEINKIERWGMVIPHPTSEEDWVFTPDKCQDYLASINDPEAQELLKQLNSLHANGWPQDMVSFLALEEDGMKALRLLEKAFKECLNRSDPTIPEGIGNPVKAVKVKAPIPRPRLYFGLVRNSPKFIRGNPNLTAANFYPLGHQRSQGTVVGPDEPVVIPKNGTDWGYNVEFGIIIGKKGRYIQGHEAMNYVAGYTSINDIAGGCYFNTINKENIGHKLPQGADFLLRATASWCGKKADTGCPMGPYLVTKDEIEDPYDLLVYTRKSGTLRDRAYTGNLLEGVERIIQWYSSFATLYPGDVMHLGTMGIDGLRDVNFGPDDYIEAEIEKVGSLKNRVVVIDDNDWREKNDDTLTHSSPAVRDVLNSEDKEIVSPADWEIKDVRHYWTVYANYKKFVDNQTASYAGYGPRFLNGPASALSSSASHIEIPPRATSLKIGIELALVINKIAAKINAEECDEYILGYTPLISLCDESFKDAVCYQAERSETDVTGLPPIYGRWADGFNIVLDQPVKISSEEVIELTMSLAIDNFGCIKGSTCEYIAKAPQILEYITQYITLFPGDVITLGRTAERITIPADALRKKGIKGMGEVDRIGSVSFSL
jgi:2-keto-4-pentenoate hydratase/2-oxohepta-3-ene-1,7-dioic acid hydratase in catechol pathway